MDWISDHPLVHASFDVHARLQHNVLTPLGFARQPLQTPLAGSTSITFPTRSVSSKCGQEPTIYVKFVAPFLPSNRKSKTSIGKKVHDTNQVITLSDVTLSASPPLRGGKTWDLSQFIFSNKSILKHSK